MPTLKNKNGFKPIPPSPIIPSLNSDSDKMRALQLFIAGTMHEIQYPLKGLLGYTQQLIDRYSQKGFEYISFKEFQEIMRTIEKMRDQTKHCVDTTQRVLDINKRRIGLEDTSCDAVLIIREAIKMVEQYALTSNVKIQFSSSVKSAPVSISPLELNQVLIHIINNAIQSIPASGGTIKMRVLYKKGEKFVRIECQDDGVGIPKENLTRIFEPFFTTKERGVAKNIGLGLTIVFTIIQACKGSIAVKSDLRQGTLIQINLPVYQDDKK